jgi:uncharacterized protein YggE
MKPLVLAALVTSVAACGRPPQIITLPSTAEVEKPGQMVVNGTATLEVSPDCADLTMTLSADGARPGVATKSVQAKERDLVAALGKLGVEAADLKLSYLTLNPIYDPNPSGWAQLSIHTYRAEITVTATTHKFDQIGAIMEAGAEAGSSSMSSQFRRSDLAELKKQVREMALTAAKAKAQQTATALGIKLGRIVSVGENVNGSMWGNAYFPQVANEMRTANAGITLGGTLQPLTLDITIGFELAREA